MKSVLPQSHQSSHSSYCPITPALTRRLSCRPYWQVPGRVPRFSKLCVLSELHTSRSLGGIDPGRATCNRGQEDAIGTQLFCRRWQRRDFKAISEIWEQVLFLGGHTSVGWLRQLSGRSEMIRAVCHNLQVVYDKRLKAATSARTHRQARPQESPHDKSDKSLQRMLRLDSLWQRRWQRQRMSSCFVLEEPATGQVVAYALLSMRQPQALLPPPLPSRAPWCMYIEGLAVQHGHRRRGAARLLLEAAERLARRCGHRSLWLHVDCSNDAAVQLYLSRGYRIAGTSGDLMSKRRFTMRKVLPAQQSAQQQSPPKTLGAQRQVDGVYVWAVDEGRDSH